MIEFTLEWGILMAGILLVVGGAIGALIMHLTTTRATESNSSAESVETDEELVASIPELTVEDQPLDTEGTLQSEGPSVVFSRSTDGDLVISLPNKGLVPDRNHLEIDELDFLTQVNTDLQDFLNVSKPGLDQQETPAPVPTEPVPVVVPMPVEEPSTPPLISILPRRRGQEEKPVESIAVQINAILQNILIDQRYEGARLYLMDNESGDLVVVLGGERYIGVDAVPDPAAANLIKMAAERWTEMNLRRKS